MKKVFKIILVFFLIIIVAMGSLAIWQRKNIESILVGIQESSEEITSRRERNQKELVKEIDTYMDSTVREFTAEEEKQLETGEIQLPELYSKLFEENRQKLEKEREQEKKKQQEIKKDEIVSKYVAQLYSSQSEFEAKAEAVIKQGGSYYESLKKTQDKATARANTITHFTPIVNGVRAECDARVETIIANLKKELEAIGAETDIIGTIRKAYENEKQLKLSYYSNKYLK